MFKSFSLAALLISSATFVACSSSEDDASEQNLNTTGKCILTVKASMPNATTRALTLDKSGAKNVLNATWTAGDKVTVYYKPASTSMPAEIGTLTATSSGSSTTLTGEITTTGISVTSIYSSTPSIHDLTAGDKLSLVYSGTLGNGGKVLSEVQDGTLGTLANYFDNAAAELTVKSVSGSTVATEEDAADFENQSFIIRFMLTDKSDNAISPSSLALECTTSGSIPLQGTENITIPASTYTTNGEGVVFVKLPNTGQTTGFSGDIKLTATVGDYTYVYEKSDADFINGKYYEIGVKMARIVNLAAVTSHTTLQNGDIAQGTLGGNYKISIADGATVTLDGVTINGTNSTDYKWAGITCLGNATINLSGTNTVKGFYEDYPGIHPAYYDGDDSYTLTIRGTGSLHASSNGRGPGIGASKDDDGNEDDGECDNIVIEGGTITAIGGTGAAGIGAYWFQDCGDITITGGTVIASGDNYAVGIGGSYQGSCGDITISGGTVTATGGQYSAGIGSGSNDTSHSSCGSITITSGVTEVNATKGASALNSIGKGHRLNSCGTITIGGTVYWDGSAYQNGGDTYLSTSPLTYQP